MERSYFSFRSGVRCDGSLTAQLAEGCSASRADRQDVGQSCDVQNFQRMWCRAADSDVTASLFQELLEADQVTQQFAVEVADIGEIQHDFAD